MILLKPIPKATRPRKIYVATSWRNAFQPAIIFHLRKSGHEVYDFRHPAPGNNGFSWSEIDPNWEEWSNEEYLAALDHPIAKAGFLSDFNAMKWADTFLLILPCGRSAHLELGWACGMGKQTVVVLDQMEPELMVKMADKICTSLDEALEVLAS